MAYWDDNNNSDNNNNKNNKDNGDIMALKYWDDILCGTVKFYGEMNCFLAFVGTHLEMVS